MYVLVVTIKLKPENVDVWMQKAREDQAGTRKEPGCRQFDVCHDPAARAAILLYEVYDDEAAFAASGIEISYMTYTGYPEYPQVYGDFQHAVSVIDLLFNTGADASAFLEKGAA